LEHAQRHNRADQLRTNNKNGNRSCMAERERWQCTPHRSSALFLEPERNCEHPTHARVDSVECPEQQECCPGHNYREILHDQAKQKESDHASPPGSRTWCGRMPSSNCTTKFWSNAIPPSAATSILASQPFTPSG